jgi:hypothetical protein
LAVTASKNGSNRPEVVRSRNTNFIKEDNNMSTPTRLNGIITTRFVNRGFGFITVKDVAGRPIQKYFLHISKLTGSPALNGVVEFDVNPILEGELPSAINAVIENPLDTPTAPVNPSSQNGGKEGVK